MMISGHFIQLLLLQEEGVPQLTQVHSEFGENEWRQEQVVRAKWFMPNLFSHGHPAKYKRQTQLSLSWLWGCSPRPAAGSVLSLHSTAFSLRPLGPLLPCSHHSPPLSHSPSFPPLAQRGTLWVSLCGDWQMPNQLLSI